MADTKWEGQVAVGSQLATSGGARLTRATLTEQLAQALRTEIIDGTLPPGQRLRSAELAERYGVSATPLREALQRLASDGFVDLDPRLQARVADVSLPDLQDIYWLRQLLEAVALERSVLVGKGGWEQRVRTAWATLSEEATRGPLQSRERVAAWLPAHRAFHDALASGGESPWLFRFVATLAIHSERYRTLSVRTRSRSSVDEHRRLFELAMSRDVAGLVAANREHLASTVRILETILTSDGGREEGEGPGRSTPGSTGSGVRKRSHVSTRATRSSDT